MNVKKKTEEARGFWDWLNRTAAAYLTLTEVGGDFGRVDGFDEQHSEIFQLQPAEIVLRHLVHVDSSQRARTTPGADVSVGAF